MFLMANETVGARVHQGVRVLRRRRRLGLSFGFGHWDFIEPQAALIGWLDDLSYHSYLPRIIIDVCPGDGQVSTYIFLSRLRRVICPKKK